jgi:hypothetical protein
MFLLLANPDYGRTGKKHHEGMVLSGHATVEHDRKVGNNNNGDCNPENPRHL